MTEQCHDRGPHAYEDAVLTNTLVLGGTFVEGAARGYWCVEWDTYSTAIVGSKYRAGIHFLRQLGFYITCEGNLEKIDV